MKIEVWSDVACPFCYIGKRRLEKGLEQFAHKDEVEIVYRSFELDPNAPKDIAEDMNTMLANKYGVSREEAAAMSKSVEGQAAAEGLEYHFDTIIMTNTFDAHRLLQYANQNGKGSEFNELLLKAHFTDSKHVGEHEVLASIAQEAGLSYDDAMAILASDQYTAEVRADEIEARNIGVRGVPFYVIDRKYAVSGAQAPETFLEVVEKAWKEANPLIVLNTDSDASADDFCADGVCSVEKK
jgi:predicted DsbA family dithiol-disulfide isomerase